VKLNQDEYNEILQLRGEFAARGEVLTAAAVREVARSPNSALFRRFSIPLEEAAEKYLLDLARRCIQLTMTVITPPGSGQEIAIRALTYSARREGYVATVELLSDEQEAAEMLVRMREEIKRTVNRYRRYAALAPHIDAALGALPAELPRG
jgi:hypothetical protein